MSFKKIQPSFLNALRIVSALSLCLGGPSLLLAKESSSVSLDAESLRYDEGKRLREQGRYEEASAAFQTVASVEPS